MKYVVIVGDGMADRPLAELGGKTPLEYAHTPNMDRLASTGILGSVRTVPEDMHPGSDVANLSILGYAPAEYYSGRAPLEAASIGVELGETDVAFRCNLVTLKFSTDRTSAIMEDYSSGHIPTKEAAELIREINRHLGSDTVSFYPGVSYRHLMVWRGGSADVECVPPHDILGKDIADYLPVGNGDDLLKKIMKDSVAVLEAHPVNRGRIRDGKNPGNCVWFWGQGGKPRMPKFRDKYGISGALVSAVDLTKGLGIYAGFEILQVPGITGYLDTNYRGKTDAALNALQDVDFVYLHVEAPDEAGHSGRCTDKIQAIEDFDRFIVGGIVEGMRRFPEHRILLLPDHATPLEIRTHSAEPVPFVIFDSRKKLQNTVSSYDEKITESEGIRVFEEGHRLMDYFIKGDNE
ncbi:MAG TPA: cofactor-independent phosphoglycerate mutase [Thermodesulfovibrionales bacterium]|nr:cofactor-independent phosphoglycerate mutase [Thermodesulfovibrionales bacterium]